jgi:hypothetical protein
MHPLPYTSSSYVQLEQGFIFIIIIIIVLCLSVLYLTLSLIHAKFGASKVSMIVNNVTRGLWKEPVVVRLKILTRKLPRRTEEKKEEPYFR